MRVRPSLQIFMVTSLGTNGNYNNIFGGCYKFKYDLRQEKNLTGARTDTHRMFLC